MNDAAPGARGSHITNGKAADGTGDTVDSSGGSGSGSGAFDPAHPFAWPRDPGKKRIGLALQGGGAHGAFTWGVIDKILEDGRIEIDAISGTSAGAMNAVVLAAGLVRGGPDRAREELATFWRTVSDDAKVSPIQRSLLDVLLSNWSLDYNPALAALEMLSRVASPYQLNPLNWNPLRDLLARSVDFEAVHACNCIELYVSATNVHTGRARVFTTHEIDADAVMASACLPFLFQAVEIDGVPYWDGGYMGNPVLAPFFERDTCTDVLIVQVNPIERPQTPRTAREISDRVNEISFNAPLLRELKQVEFVNACLRRGELQGLGYREVFLHRIGGCNELLNYGASTKLNAEWAFLKRLRDTGREAAAQWLAAHFSELGSRSTLDFAGVRPHFAPEDPVPDNAQAVQGRCEPIGKTGQTAGA